MRVRPLRSKTDTPRLDRRPHQRPASAPERLDEALAAERRLRASGGPDDIASYGCACGYLFEAPVSTGVSCPHCGAAQAW